MHSRLLDRSQEPPLAGANLQRGDIHLELCPTLGTEITKPSLVHLPACSEANLLTPSCGEGKYNVFAVYHIRSSEQLTLPFV